MTSASPARAVHRARVLSVAEVAPRHFQLQLRAPALAQEAQPGQFVHVLTAPNPQPWNFDPFLRRAFSIMSVANSPSPETLDVLFRVEGRGTQLLSTARAGDDLNLIGPLGKPFDIGLFHVKQADALPRAIVVGGGVGVPPLVFLSRVLGEANAQVVALIGARGQSEIIGRAALESAGATVEIATDDGSVGHHGRVTDLLAAQLEGDSNAIVYACGPFPMLRAVAILCQKLGVRAQVSLEEAMPCGIGVCNGCVVRARTPFAGSQEANVGERVGDEWSPYHTYRRICVEGPACWADEIEWEETTRGTA